ncbi:hypothetical protein YC2023_007118 [Brassica napus]
MVVVEKTSLVISDPKSNLWLRVYWKVSATWESHIFICRQWILQCLGDMRKDFAELLLEGKCHMGESCLFLQTWVPTGFEGYEQLFCEFL